MMVRIGGSPNDFGKRLASAAGWQAFFMIYIKKDNNKRHYMVSVPFIVVSLPQEKKRNFNIFIKNQKTPSRRAS